MDFTKKTRNKHHIEHDFDGIGEITSTTESDERRGHIHGRTKHIEHIDRGVCEWLV
jgi:hypothetical protein